MIVINSKIQARPAKRQELLQTLHELAAEKRALRGFVNSCIYMEGGNQETFTLIEEWADSEAVAQYQQSPCFQIFIGAQTVLAHSVESAMFEVATRRVRSPGSEHAWKKHRA